MKRIVVAPKTPSKETCLKMAQLFCDARNETMCWFYLLGWSNYKHFDKHEWAAYFVERNYDSLIRNA